MTNPRVQFELDEDLKYRLDCVIPYYGARKPIFLRLTERLVEILEGACKEERSAILGGLLRGEITFVVKKEAKHAKDRRPTRSTKKASKKGSGGPPDGDQGKQAKGRA